MYVTRWKALIYPDSHNYNRDMCFAELSYAAYVEVYQSVYLPLIFHLFTAYQLVSVLKVRSYSFLR